jgi:ATP-dependent exoDNAse (exonuclease V) beta subunit
MLNKNDTLGNAVAYLEHLLTRDGRIHLMTGHKSKGLEFNTVYFLDQHLCQIKRDQDANIKYVIETRAKDALHYVTSDTFEGGLTDEEAA